MLSEDVTITKEELQWILYLLTKHPEVDENQEVVHFLISRFAGHIDHDTN